MIDHSSYDIQRQVSEAKAEQILIVADIVRIDKDAAGEAQKLAILIHEVRGNGVKGIGQRLEDVEAQIIINPKDAKANRYNALGIAMTIVGTIVGLLGLGALLGLIKGGK